MSTYNLTVYGKNVKFAAKTLAQALFAQQAHIEHLRAKARERMAAKRAANRLREVTRFQVRPKLASMI